MPRSHVIVGKHKRKQHVNTLVHVKKTLLNLCTEFIPTYGLFTHFYYRLHIILCLFIPKTSAIANNHPVVLFTRLRLPMITWSMCQVYRHSA